MLLSAVLNEVAVLRDPSGSLPLEPGIVGFCDGNPLSGNVVVRALCSNWLRLWSGFLFDGLQKRREGGSRFKYCFGRDDVDGSLPCPLIHGHAQHEIIRIHRPQMRMVDAAAVQDSAKVV